MGVITTVESAASTLGLPVAAVTLAVFGIMPGALALAAVASAAGIIGLLVTAAPGRGSRQL